MPCSEFSRNDLELPVELQAQRELEGKQLQQEDLSLQHPLGLSRGLCLPSLPSLGHKCGRTCGGMCVQLSPLEEGSMLIYICVYLH